MDGAMGQEEDVVEAVLTCEGDFHDPELFKRIEKFRHGLKDLLFTEKHKLQVKKVEPWNSVKVTLTIPRDAASRLRQLAHSGNDSLRQMGVLSVQIQGDSQISLTLAGRNNEPTEFVLRAPALSTTSMGSDSDFAVLTDHTSSPGPSNDEVTRKNIVDYLRQGSALRQNASLFESILGGVGTSSPALGLGLGISQHSSTFQNPSLNNSTFRQNSISCIAAQSPGLRGSSLRNSFPFTKSTGAFHPPVPRLPASAGQSPVTKPIQSGNRPVGQNVTLSQVVHINSNSHTALSSSISNFNPAGPLRLPASLSPNFHSQNALLPPPSSSPTSAMMMDLPPPPPYPHNNNSRPGKPVTASSPLLVNLLQTDPLMVAAGMASGNPNKPLTLGDLEGPPPKKKKRSKKSKDGLAKSFSLTESLAHNNLAFSHGLSNSGIDLNRLSRVSEDTCSIHLSTPFTFKDSSPDVVQPRTGAISTSHIPDSLIPNFRPDSKPSYLPDRPVIQSHKDNFSYSKFQLETSRSAIGVSNVSSKHSDSMMQESLPKDLDPFNLEISAGKIVNPYTGQLEPRDSVDMGLISDNFATQILAKKAKEMDELNKISVPISASHSLDVHVGTSPVSLSNSTAGYIRSGGPFQVCSERKNSVSPLHRNLIADGSVKDLKQSAPSNIYALPSRQDIAGSLVPDASALTLPSPSHATVNKSSPVQKNVSSASVPMNGPVLSSQSLSPSHFEFIETSLPSGASSTQSGSVIYSNTALSPPVMRASLSQPSVQQAMSVPPVIEAARVRPTSSMTPHHPKPILSPNASDRIPLLPNIHNQAASSDIIGNIHGTKFSSPHLLNSFPEKHIDSLSGTESPPEKVSSEGDDNSNHSCVATDSLPENSGAAALIEHSGVKTENHDSGLGSSSERSDDTPSEPGDNEFRPSNTVGENEETAGKTALAKSVASCKLDSKQLNSITVGYMVTPSETASQSKLIPSKYSPHLNIKASWVPNRTASSSSMSQLIEAQGKASERQNGQQTSLSASWPLESKLHYQSSCSGLLKENSVESVPVSSQNGPSSTNLDQMLTIVNESQQKKMRSSPKQSIKKDAPSEHMKLQAEVLEKISKLHQFADSTKIISDQAAKASTLEREDSSDTLSRPVNLEEKVEHIIFDMEELVNGKTLGNGGVGLEGKGGSNITSIYSKRSSPVNVNMLNHIYAPGLPLPRRLTESVQRLVKPLPASESSANLPNARACKSPASGNSSRSLSSTNGSSNRVSYQSGTRSPGASMPKLVPNDKYSLLSGGLDLAGLSTLQYSSTGGGESIHYSKLAVPVMTADLSLKDTSPLSPPKLIFDTKSLSNKMLSQSYPPLKYKENSPHLAQETTDQNSSIQSSHFPKPKFEIPNLSQELKQLNCKMMEQTIPQTNRVFLDTGSTYNPTKVAIHTTACKDNTHSSHDNNSVDISIGNSSHSSTVTLMQQGQDLAINLPNVSSRLPFLSTSPEISLPGSSTGTMIASTTSSTQSVPYTPSTQGTNPVTLRVSLCSSPSPLPVLYPIPVSSVVNKAETSLATSTQSKSSGAESPTPPKLTKVSLPCNPPPLFPRTGSHLNRNLFESVTSTLTTEDMQCDLNSSELISCTSSTETATEWLSRTIQKKSPDHDKSSLIVNSPKHSEGAAPSLALTEVHRPEFRKFEILSKNVNISNNSVNIANVLEDKTLTLSSIAQDNVQTTETHTTQIAEVKSQGTVLPENQNSTSIHTHPDSESHNCVDIVAETIASVAAGVEGSVNNLQPLLPALSQVKEPILETLASSLRTTLSSAVSKPLPITAVLATVEPLAMSYNSAEEMKANKPSGSPSLLNIEDGCIRTPGADSGKSADNSKIDSVSGESQAAADTDSVESSTKRITRKRKSTHSEGDSRDGESEVSASETTPVKQVATTNSQETPKQAVKSVSIINSKLDLGVSKPFKDVSTLKTYSKAGNLGNGGVKVSTSETSAEKDSTRQSKPRRASLSEEKDNQCVHEGNLSSSADSKKTAKKDTSPVLNNDIKLHGSADDQETSQAIASDLKDSLHKENRCQGAEEQKETHPQLTASLDEQIKTSNKDDNDKGIDEGHKKGHRIRRQFYAYVPEKSIDQTYFDTPILSGRTRSKNKPAEQSMEGGAQDSGTVIDSNHVEASQIAPSNKGDANLEGGSAKRPTRSVRAKDNPQDQSVNKRRKVQQHR